MEWLGRAVKVVGRGEAVITFPGTTPPDLSGALTTFLKLHAVPREKDFCSLQLEASIDDTSTEHRKTSSEDLW